MSNTELFDAAYRSIWMALHRKDDPDLSQHEREILSHVPIGGCSLGDIVRHLVLPKSTGSEIVKSLAQRGFLLRVRDSVDERRVRLTLTVKGNARVAEDRVLDDEGLARALRAMPARDRATLLLLMHELGNLAIHARPVRGRPRVAAAGRSRRQPPRSREIRSIRAR